MTQQLEYDWEPIQTKLLRVGGTDLDVVNAARRSFGKQSDWETYDTGAYVQKRLSAKDVRLLNFLGRGMSVKDFDAFIERVAALGWGIHEEAHREDFDHDILDQKQGELATILQRWRSEPTHDTPFNHVSVHIAIMVPAFTARQLVKHEYMPWSEVSRRYIGQAQEPGEEQERLCFWRPNLGDGIQWRSAPLDRKQGSGGPLLNAAQAYMDDLTLRGTDDAYWRFYHALRRGASMEQARMLLPLNLMVEVTWSGFLGAFAKMLRERLGLGAQEEARVVAKQLYDAVLPHFPVSLPALVPNR